MLGTSALGASAPVRLLSPDGIGRAPRDLSWFPAGRLRAIVVSATRLSIR